MIHNRRGGRTYIGLRRRQAELDQADLGLLYTGQSAVHHLLGQNQTVHQLTVIYGSSGKHRRRALDRRDATRNQNEQPDHHASIMQTNI